MEFVTRLEQHLMAVLFPIKAHLHEMEVRRWYSQTELLGHFCTELRRRVSTSQYRGAIWSTDLWAAPFMPCSNLFHWGNVVINVNQEVCKVSRDCMERICTTVLNMSDDEIEVGSKLACLSIELPSIQRKSVELERLTRSMQALSIEITDAQGAQNG